MPLTFRKLHPPSSPRWARSILRRVHDRDDARRDPRRDGRVRHSGVPRSAVHRPGAARFRAALRRRSAPNTGAAVLGKNRFGNEALTDISNLDEKGEILNSEDRRRMYALGNRLWHTDASFQDPPGPLLDAVGAGHPAGRRRHRVRRHARRLRRARRRRPKRSSKACGCTIPSPTRGRRSGSSSRRRRRRSSKALSIRSCASIRAPRADPCILHRMPRASWTGLCRRGGCCCATSSSTRPSRSSSTAMSGAPATW